MIFFHSNFSTSPTPLPTVDDAAVQRAVEEVASAIAHQEVEPRMQHVMAHDLGHGEAVSVTLTSMHLRIFLTQIFLKFAEFLSTTRSLWNQ